MSEHHLDSEQHNACEDHPSDVIDLVIRGRPRDLGGGTIVRRTLPSMRRRLVGPFIFFDHMGPVEVPAGGGMDVRPHPHIALATITYLFEGTVFHRDSVGSAQAIRPGDVNWMIAGKGIAHSERTPPEVRAQTHRMHGMQVWVALRKAEEDIEPKFIHQPASTLPFVEKDGCEIRLIAGKAFGHEVPPLMQTPTLYADAKMAKKGSSKIDLPSGYEQRAIYVVSGAVVIEGETFPASTMIIFKPGSSSCAVASEDNTRIMILGGDAIDGERFIWWNFVASSKEKIEDAKARWRDRKFASIPGDDEEFIPLPET
jgi:redox-sensitive bicupin YhaK (pirin superfamily)